MAAIVAVVSQKGGAGKTSLARAIATAFAAAGWQTEIADMDIDQGTATAWQQRRLRAGTEPTITVRQFGNPEQAISKAGSCDMLIFDGAPKASKATAVMAKAADLVIIPTGLALDDLEPAVALANALVDRDGVPVARIVFALNQTGTSALEIEEARSYLNKTRFDVLDGEIPKKPAFSRAQDAGLSLIETPFKGPREQAAQVIRAAVARFESLTA
ncbi:chromosome partitioning protein [Pseudomonas sp. SJZ085]|uniref:nucleotide-binding protein n=1 Tax=unclassified Pseudomonas TaxID=196821 RepID=UPI00119A9FBC|nr:MULTISPECIES: partition protein parA [unclassified Pseudomonas]TWC12042.1 chromosome partitioning protein [Pseudomonas sp. SJZ074]TWC30623.1 chromosome partitioning protein [Pseudomonas sp. SJZ085]